MSGSFNSPRYVRLLLVLAALLLLAGRLSGPAVAADSVQLSVIDGDTLELNGRPIELTGIDAPELGQHCLDGERLYACGLAPANELKKLLTLDPVECRPLDAKRRIFDCRTSRASLGQLLVEAGLVVAKGDVNLLAIERQVRSVPLGIWRGSFIDPADWRRGERLPEELDNDVACPILTRVVAGEALYWVPTDIDYARVRAGFPPDGQRFCDDEAARAGGFHHASAE